MLCEGALHEKNTIRKYYADMLAKRKPGKDEDGETPIPPVK